MAKKRFSIYLLGAPKFLILTAHKPLVTMFNKATAKLPPRIEQWVMSMQDVDFQLIYEPGKDEADPLDYLSRHPLPVTGDDKMEMIKLVVAGEHAVVVPQIREETKKDNPLQKIVQTIKEDSWERQKKDPDIMPFYSIRGELYLAEGVILRMNKIIIPKNLQKKVLKAAHSLGHFGMTKTKNMLRAKYWFPEMNKMVEDMVGKCYECQVTTKQHQKQPVKMTDIPKNPWEVVSTDFGGPYPDGHYNLVVIDKRSRYPEVEKTHSTAAKPTIDKFRKMFSTHGIPRRLESDGGPPFKSQEFADYAQESGFEHHVVTPEHAPANGEAESFMKVLNKTEQIAHMQRVKSRKPVLDMLMGYRDIPHPATGVTSYEVLMGRKVRTKLDNITSPSQNELNDMIEEKDKCYKDKLKEYADRKRGTKEHSFVVGDYVLLEQKKKNKWTTAYEPAFYNIYRINGSSVWARRVSDGREICRDASKFKLANAVVRNMDEEKRDIPNLSVERE